MTTCVPSVSIGRSGSSRRKNPRVRRVLCAGRSLRAAPEEMQRQVLEKGVLTGRNQSMILVTTALPMRFQNVLPKILAVECLL